MINDNLIVLGALVMIVYSIIEINKKLKRFRLINSIIFIFCLLVISMFFSIVTLYLIKGVVTSIDTAYFTYIFNILLSFPLAWLLIKINLKIKNK